MDDALAGRLKREWIVAGRLYRFARAVSTACLDVDARKGAIFDLPPPYDVLPASVGAADLKIAAQDPSLKALVKAIQADRQGALPRDTAAVRRDMSLLQWWALFGDFEFGLQRRLGEASTEQPKKGLWSKPRVESTNKGHLREGIVELTRGTGDPDPNTLHPIAWYVKCVSVPIWSPYIDGRAVAEVLALHGTGGWRTWLDVQFEFYDAVTNAAARRFVSSLSMGAPDGKQPLAAADFAKCVSESARVFGLPSDRVRQSFGEIAFSSCGAWTTEEPSVCLRHSTHSCGGRVLPIFMHARPIAYVRSVVEQPSWPPRIFELMRQAEKSWPEHDALGSWLAHEFREPTREVADALAAIGGIIGRSLAASTARSAGFSDGSFVRHLQRVLKRCGVVVVESDTTSRRLANRFPQNGRWALSINGSITIQLGEAKKATCPTPLSDAIDRYDQFVWACATLAEISGKPAWTDAKDAFLDAGAWGEQWEHVKGQLLDLPQEPTVSQLVDSFHAVRAICLRLEQSLRKPRASDKPSPNVHETLHATSQLRNVVAALLGLAGENVNDACGHFYPPRVIDGDLAGDVDVGKWLDDPWWYGGGRNRHRCDIKIRGTGTDAVQVGEDIAAVGRTFTLSLPFATQDDEKLIVRTNALIWSGDQVPPGYVQTIHECLKTSVDHAIRSRGKIDFTGALGQLRNRFAADGGADRFDDMVERAIRGEDSASACLSILRSDSRSDLNVFPEVSESEGKWTLQAPRPTDTELTFRFSEKPQDEPIRIRYATSRDKAKRVISRGPEDGTGLQPLARPIGEWCKDLPESLQLYAKNIMRRSDRHALFGEQLTKGIEAVAAILQLIAQSDAEGSGATFSAAQRDEGFQRLKAWLAAAGGKVEPETWSSDLGADSIPAEAQESRAEFHSHVPEGRIVVKGFRIIGEADGVSFSHFQGYRSAGPPASQYQDLLLLGNMPGCDFFVKWLHGVPESKLKGKEPYKSDIYRLYHALSSERHRRMTGRVQEYDCPSDFLEKAVLLLEKWYEDAFECESFPKEQEVVEVIEKCEFDSVEPGEEIEAGLVRVVVKGFRFKRGAGVDKRVQVRKETMT